MTITKATVDSDFPGARYRLDWAELCASGPLGNHQLEHALGSGDALYSLENTSVNVDISGNRDVRISRRHPALFDACFASGESILLARNIVGRPAILLTFDQPVRSAGARVGVSAGQAISFWAHCSLLLDDGNWYPVSPARKGRHEIGATGARFMGGTAKGGLRIKAAWFDVLDLVAATQNMTAPSVDLAEVGIGDLYYVP